MSSEVNKLMQIAIPSTIAWLGHIGYHLVNNILIGKIIGINGLAAAGIAASLYLVVLMLGLGASTVISSLISSLNNRHSAHKIAAAFQNSIFLCTALGIIMAIALFVSAPYTIPLVNKQHLIDIEAVNYLKIISITFITTMIFYAFQRLCEGLGNSKPTMYTTILCNVTNGIMSYGFLTGSFGLPDIGIYGPAISSLINGVIEVLIIAIIVMRHPILGKAIEFSKFHLSLQQLKKISIIAIPSGLLIFFEGCAFNIAAFFASQVSVESISAHQIILWTLTTILIPIFGLSSGITSRIAYNAHYLSGRLKIRDKLISSIVKKSVIYSVVYGVIGMTIVYLLRNPFLASILKESDSSLKTVEIINSILPLMIVFIAMDITQLLFASILRAFSDTFVPSIYSLITYWCIGIPLSYILGVKYGFGLKGIWLGLGIGLTFQALFLFYRYINHCLPILRKALARADLA